MEQESHTGQLDRPPAYNYPQSDESNHIHNLANLPSVPKTDIPAIHHERTLPPLPALPEPRREMSPEAKYQAWPSANPFSVYYESSSTAQSSPKIKSTTSINSPNMTYTDSTAQDDRSRRGGSVLSIDDPDVRLAAEALGDLKADFVQSPPAQHSNLPGRSVSFQNNSSASLQPEPLLSLLTTSHPLIGTTITSSLSAYSASKNYSPRFKSSAEYVERRITPVVNTVSSINRVTGVEGGVRWFLGGRQPSHHSPSDIESGDGTSHKRRRIDGSQIDIDRDLTQDEAEPSHLRHRERRPSQSSIAESLPAYDDHTSPKYEATEEQALVQMRRGSVSTPGGGTWPSRLILSTSGLSVAMSEESLRSLKYCLGWLRWANDRLAKAIATLKSIMEQYDGRTGENPLPSGENGGQLVLRTDVERSELNRKIGELKGEVLQTLKGVVDVIHKYTGGALPENAKELVRRQLTSLPQRFSKASTITSATDSNGASNPDGEVRQGAGRVMVFAQEGLDMLAQVSGVLNGTIVSAEEWCERLGRKQRDEAEGQESSSEKNVSSYFPSPPPPVPQMGSMDSCP